MLSREDFYMIKQMHKQGASIIDIATQVGCSERTVRRYLKYPEPPARKTRHKMAKLKPFMDYIDTHLAENIWNGEVILAEIKAMGYTGGRSMLRYYCRRNLAIIVETLQIPDMMKNITMLTLSRMLTGNGNAGKTLT